MLDVILLFFFLMIRRPPRSTLDRSSAASDVYKRQIQAQALAQQGLGTLVIDLYGTGESDGEYGDARWDTWLEDIRYAEAWLDDQPGGCVALLGIRLGFPLAVSTVRNSPKTRVLIAWQAVVDGKSYFTQFMRMKMAANMDRTDIPKETSGGMRAQLAAGSSI